MWLGRMRGLDRGLGGTWTSWLGAWALRSSSGLSCESKTISQAAEDAEVVHEEA